MSASSRFYKFYRSGYKMPTVAYGCAQAPHGLANHLEVALEAGYRHFDTAWVYGTESVLGDVLNTWMYLKKIRRDELFVTTKLPAKGMRADGVKKYLKESLNNLKLKYLDLYLIHAPFGVRDDGNAAFPIKNGKVDIDKTTDLTEIWRAMEEAVIMGQVKSIGLSNFNIKQIQRVQTIAKIPPANLQMEMHVYHQQTELLSFCRKHNILVSAYAPLTSTGIEEFLGENGPKRNLPNPFNENVVKAIATKHKKTEGQVLLRHLLQKGVAVVTKSATPDRIRGNIEIFDFVLDVNDMKDLDVLDRGEKGRIFDFLFFPGIEEHPEYPF